MSLSVEIDYREKGLVEILRNFHDLETHIEVCNLDVGDIRILHDDLVVAIIERKTSQDLLSSIKDGRYKEQKARLVDNYALNKIYYLIEISECFRPQTVEAIRGAIINTLLRDDIKVVMVNNIHNTAYFIKDIVNRLQKFPKKYIGIANASVVKPSHVHTKKTCITPEHFLIDVLSHIPSVSTNIARVVAEHYDMNLEKMMKEYDEKIVAELKLVSSGRRVGPKIATRIKTYLYKN